ncbi:aminoglycoside 6-adenylyltransferase, partial [Enterococcus faecalis]
MANSISFVRKPSAREYDDCCNEFWNVQP